MTDFQGVVYGKLQSKSNSRRITRSGMVIKSQKALEFTNNAIVQLRALYKARQPILGDIGLEITVFYETKRNDLDVQLFMDCLQSAGVIDNDRQIRQIAATKMWDKTAPRVEFCLYDFDD